jgi:uridylate kinase
MQKDYIVISLGGSILVPQEVDIEFLKSFVSFIKEQVSLGKSFGIITGGGHVARVYRDALKGVGVSSSDTLDWMGIGATRLNAVLLRHAFGTEENIFLEPKDAQIGEDIIIGGGWKPGHSSDGAAVELARVLHAKTVLNLSNIDYVFTDDPRKNPNAEKIEKISWTDFKKLLPESWDPGINAPFDPIAARMAEESGIKVVVMNGKNIDNLKKYFSGESFSGTVIEG